MGKHGPSTPVTRHHLNIQRERALLVKALIAAGKSDEDIVKSLLVDEDLARSFLAYGKNY